MEDVLHPMVVCKAQEVERSMAFSEAHWRENWAEYAPL